jgi:hypothetical protein
VSFNSKPNPIPNAKPNSKTVGEKSSPNLNPQDPKPVDIRPEPDPLPSLTTLPLVLFFYSSKAPCLAMRAIDVTITVVYGASCGKRVISWVSTRSNTNGQFGNINPSGIPDFSRVPPGFRFFSGWKIHGYPILVIILVLTERFSIHGFCSPFFQKEHKEGPKRKASCGKHVVSWVSTRSNTKEGPKPKAFPTSQTTRAQPN